MRFLRTAVCIAIGAITANSADSGAEIIKALFKRPLYAQPVATTLGTGSNAGWYQSASVGKDFGWGISLPVSLIFINKGDRQYSDTYTDQACVECRKQAAVNPAVNCQECVECTEFTAPTLFGTIHTPRLTESIIDQQFNYATVPNGSVEPVFTTGVSSVAEYYLLPFASLQAMISWNYTALTLRYLGIPAIAGVSFQFPGVGIHHDLSRFLPPVPVSLSAAGNITFLNASWKIKDVNNVEGTLKLSGMSNFVGILAGMQFAFIETFLELGWEHSFLKPGGSVSVNGEQLTAEGVIPGRNGFRAALNISLPVKYNPVIGGIGGAQFGTQLNLLSFKSKKS